MKFVSGETIEVARGSGNVFRDLGHSSPDLAQLKAILAAEIIHVLEKDKLTVRAAHALTGLGAADFSRIRNAYLGQFTLVRLVSIATSLGSRIGMRVKVRTLDSNQPAVERSV